MRGFFAGLRMTAFFKVLAIVFPDHQRQFFKPRKILFPATVVMKNSALLRELVEDAGGSLR